MKKEELSIFYITFCCKFCSVWTSCSLKRASGQTVIGGIYGDEFESIELNFECSNCETTNTIKVFPAF